MNRVRLGWCSVSNPFNARQVTRVSLRPDDVDAIVFWSKNPAPILASLRELDEIGLRYYFQFTLNNYPTELEPGVPSLADRLRTFENLSSHLGSPRVIWRYDPIVISNRTSYEFHRRTFEEIAGKLNGMTKRVMISVIDFYKKTDRRLTQLEKSHGFVFDKQPLDSLGIFNLASDLVSVAGANGIELYTCAEEGRFRQAGVRPGSCIDIGLINRLWPDHEVMCKKDPYQRAACLCVASKDIGMNDTCMHGCRYCYATVNNSLAEKRHAEHDPDAPILWGNSPSAGEEIPHGNEQMKLL